MCTQDYGQALLSFIVHHKVLVFLTGDDPVSNLSWVGIKGGYSTLIMFISVESTAVYAA